MKLYVASVMSLLFSFSAQAATKMETVRDLFQKSLKPSLSQVEGVFAGRCFYGYTGADQDDAMGMVLVTYKVQPPAENAGPLFPSNPPQAQYKINILQSADDAHFRFDNMSESEVRKAVGNADAIKSTPVADVGTGLGWDSVYNSGSGPFSHFELRISSQGYLVSEGTYTKDVTDSPDGRNAHTGEKVYCYFYKKLP